MYLAMLKIELKGEEHKQRVHICSNIMIINLLKTINVLRNETKTSSFVHCLNLMVKYETKTVL